LQIVQAAFGVPGKQSEYDGRRKCEHGYERERPDALKRATEAGVKFPSSPSPDPKDGKALTTALYKAGVDPASGFNVEYMLDRLVSHPIHDQVMDDIDAKYGKTADGVYHSVTLVVFQDLKKAYNL
jgi:hypothetical protein